MNRKGHGLTRPARQVLADYLGRVDLPLMCAWGGTGREGVRHGRCERKWDTGSIGEMSTMTNAMIRGRPYGETGRW